MGSTANTSFPSRKDLTSTSCSGFNFYSPRARTLKSAKALARTSTSAAILAPFLSDQNFAAASSHRNKPIGVFIAGIPFPPSPFASLFVCSTYLPPPRPLYMPAMQATSFVSYIQVYFTSSLQRIYSISTLFPWRKADSSADMCIPCNKSKTFRRK